ncbi:SusC/RagA family TonB-linked outer membrane protein [Pedobacter yulinensis]|uniref:SusC/RagA family TonB-linked outer membrane protein n=1 Tax=Pedobacter yulinensis TaxID=2126353 RepID=A0A2T3HGM9_9SPHI|nr:SusC/RagA family TonB-linked outer membrane protein [Pedobacter yulinensis]PST81595.1 SusC/RagA family TonB-linked outer membrane protein [Pedobacter yulinensis]
MNQNSTQALSVCNSLETGVLQAESPRGRSRDAGSSASGKSWRALLIAFVLVLSGLGVRAQNLVVKGRVVDDADNSAVIGVNIMNAQRQVLGTTDVNGAFSISVAAGGQVTFSIVGYTQLSRSFTAAAQNVLVRMKPASNALDEVVVTALGIKREEKSLGYAVTKVDSTDLTRAVSSNWTDALSGKVAGLNLVRSNSGPAGSNKIILRGENNLTGDNEALIVVDGVVINNSGGRRSANGSDNVYGTGSDNMPADYGSSLNDINPEDIESVSVLKGPGAAALYGQRGANGAIIITTKSGSSKNKKNKIGIKFTSNGSLESVNRWPDLQYEYGQGTDGATYYSYDQGPDGLSTSGTSSAYGPRFDPNLMFYQYDPVKQGQASVRTPWVPYKNQIREFFETGQNLSNSLSIDTKIGSTTGRLSLTNQENTWIIPNTGFERTTAALSTTTDITKKLKLTTKLNYGNRFSDNLPGAGYGNQSLMYWFIFWQPNADLNWLKNYWQNGQENLKIEYPFSSFPENPYAISNEFINRTGRHNVTANVTASYQFTKALSLQLRSTVDWVGERRAQDRPYDAGSKLPYGSHREQKIRGSETNNEFLVRYSKKFSKIDVNALVGGSQLKNRYNRSDLRADGLVIPKLYELTNNRFPIVSIPDTSRYNINSFFGSVSLGYKNYLYLDVTGRQDWSSVLATPTRTDNVGFFYPSVSGSFVLSEVTKLPEAISFAKLRASVSQVGSGSTTPYRTAYTYGLAASGQYPDSALLNPSILPNPDLQPLKTTTFEVGAEVNFFKNRLNVDVAFYSGNTKNQILTRIVDRSSGYTSALINAGRVDNSGFEASVNGTIIKGKGKGFNWRMFSTFSTNRNQIKELADSSVILRTGPVGGGQIVARVGGSMGDLYGRGYERDPQGNVIYDGTTGFAKISQNVVYLGNTIPKYRASLGTEFAYQNFSLNVLFDAQMGAVGHSLTNYKLVEQGKTTSTLPGRYSGIIGNGVVQNPDGSFRPNDVVANDIDEYYRSHMGTDNAEGNTFSTDYIKFREAALNYKFSPRVAKSLGLNSMSFGVYGRNLFIWSPWPMFDPEFGTLAGSDIVQGFEVAQFPSTRTFGFNFVIGI